MTASSSKESKNVARWRRTQVAAAFGAASVMALVPTVLTGASGTTLKTGKVPSYSGALVNHSSRSLYVLSSEKGAKIKCGASCITTWPPLLVKSSATVQSVSLGAGVKGKIGFVTRSKTMKQVTFNTFPLYTYQGDTGSLQSNGEGITADGGTWTLVKANATSASATAYKSTSGGGGYGSGGGY